MGKNVTRKNRSFYLPVNMIEEIKEVVKEDSDIDSMNHAVETAISDFLKKQRQKILENKIKEAAKDPMFMEDLKKTMDDFKYVDSQSARRLDSVED